MGWLIAVAVLVILALTPLGVRVRYDASGLKIALIAGFIRIQLIPGKEKENKETKNRDEVKKTEKKKENVKKKSGGSITDFLPLVRTALDFLNSFRRKLRVDRLTFKLILGGGDPCDLALNYGKGWAVLGNFMPLFDRVFVIKKRDLEVECDFTANSTTIIASADFTICVWRLLALVFKFGPRAIKQYVNVMKIRKGGANT